MHDTRRKFLLPPITGLGDVLNRDVWLVMEMKRPLELPLLRAGDLPLVA
jgi:hypothetical protein